MNEQVIRKKILEISQDPNLTEAEKAKKRQELLSGAWLKKQTPKDNSKDRQGMFGVKWQLRARGSDRQLPTASSES